jgi:hypothetical protein
MLAMSIKNNPRGEVAASGRKEWIPDIRGHTAMPRNSLPILKHRPPSGRKFQWPEGFFVGQLYLAFLKLCMDPD